MRGRLIRNYKTSALLLGIFSVAALPPYYLFPVLIITFSTFILLLNSLSSSKQAFAAGYWFGFGWFSLGFSWIGNALLIDAASFGWLYPLVIIGSGGFFGLFAAFPAMFAFRLKGLPARLLGFAALWVFFEWLRSFVLTGFPWNLLGSVLAFSPLTLQFAAVAGTYGLSLLVLLMTMAPALWLNAPSKKNLSISLTLFLGVGIFIAAFGWLRLAGNKDPALSDITLRIVQPGIPQTMKWSRESLESNLREYIRLSQTPSSSKINFVVWGETASPFPLDIDEEHRRAVSKAVPAGGYLITGSLRYHFDRYGEPSPLNSLLIIGENGQIAASYDKSHLVPFGEYIPFRRLLPASIRPITNAIRDFIPGNGPESIKLPGYPELGAVICYEIIFPTQIINAANRPDWIVNVTNDGWYGNSAGPYQHLAAARLRAVEEGITVVRAANTGISAVIAPNGTVINSLGLDAKGVLDARLPEKLKFDTLYGKFGNTVPFILCFLDIILAVFLSRHKR